MKNNKIKNRPLEHKEVQQHQVARRVRFLTMLVLSDYWEDEKQKQHVINKSMYEEPL